MKKFILFLIPVFVVSACFAQKTTIDSLAGKLVALIESKNPYMKQYSNLEKTDSIWDFPINGYITTAKHYFGGFSKKKLPVSFFQSYTDNRAKFAFLEKKIYHNGCWNFYASIKANDEFPSFQVRFDKNNNVVFLSIRAKIYRGETFFYQLKGKKIYTWKSDELYYWKKRDGKLISIEDFQKELVSFQRFLE